MGAKTSELLEVDGKEQIVKKGFRQNEECYSGFGTAKNATELAEELKKMDIKKVVVVGLALDYCVGSTALDSKKNGFETYVVS